MAGGSTRTIEKIPEGDGFCCASFCGSPQNCKCDPIHRLGVTAVVAVVNNPEAKYAIADEDNN